MADCPRCKTADAYLGPITVECCNPQCYFYSEDWAIDRACGQTAAPTDLSSQSTYDETTPPMQMNFWLPPDDHSD